MYVVFDQAQNRHVPEAHLFAGKLSRCPDRTGRTDRLLAAAREFGCDLISPPDAGLDPILAVHKPEYLEFLQHAPNEWIKLENASDEIFPHVFGVRYVRGRPSSVLGLAGLYMTGTNCPIGLETWSAAYASAQAAIEAARLVCEGAHSAYALCRPSGHHAYADLAGGFCYLNNAAIAATQLRRQFSRVVVIDIDVHHGNGTQEIFYFRDDVYFVSVHADPVNYFPFYAGYSSELGEGQGYGFNLNLPLEPGSGDIEVTTAVRRCLDKIADFSPQALVVSLGFDAAATDPLGVFKVTASGFQDIGTLLGRLGLPAVLVQEGGYDTDALGLNLIAFLSGFTARQDSRLSRAFG